MNNLKILPSPRTVDIAITGKCNLKCKYCFYADEMVALRDLPTKQWLAFFDELGRLGVMDVCLTGGEVFSRPDLFELIDGIVANRMRYNLLTNGTLITKHLLEQFDRGKRRIRLNSIQISVDGSRAEIHNLSRPDSFERVMRGIRLLMEARFPLTTRVTLNRYNVDDLDNIARLLLEDLGLPSFGTNDVYACGITDRSEEKISLTLSQQWQAIKTLSKLEQQYNGRVLAQAGPLAMAQDLKKIEDALSLGETSLPGRGTLCACGGVFRKIGILHDGTIVPCHNLSSLHLGNILRDDFQQIWREHEVMNSLRRRREIPLDSLDTCTDCEYQGFCTGGCPAGAVFLTGDWNERNPFSCYRVFKGEDPYFTLEENI